MEQKTQLAIEFVCSQCQCELRVRDEDAGKKARCPRCGMIHEVPQQVSSSPATTAEQETAYYNPSSSAAAAGSVEAGQAGRLWSLKTPDGQIYGPVSRSDLDQWAREGRVSAECLVQASGEAHWQSALTLFPELAGIPQSRPSDYAPRRATRTRPVHQRRHQLASDRRPNNGVAIFVMGILGIVFWFMPVFALIALFMGASERKAMDRGEASSSGRWMADVGFALGVIGSVLGGLTIFGCCLVPAAMR